MTLEPQSGQFRILVVDDHAISAFHAVAALSQGHGQVRWSKSASEALDLALHWYPHLIFMDLHLHGTNGLALVSRIREKWPVDRPAPKIIVITGDETVQAGGDLASLEIDQLLLKPVSGNQLRHAAGLAKTNAIGEPRASTPRAELSALCREELQQRLPELEVSLTVRKRKKAAQILHQLIASAAMCGESRLESALRSLDSMCRQEQSPGDLARCYHAFLETAGEFISRETPQ